jgi:hypothetical protein
MPETSKLGPAMEEAGKDATESFDKGTSGLGDKIHDSFTKATGKVKDVFHKAGSDASESMADGVKEQSAKVEAALEDTGDKASSKFRAKVGGIGKDLGKQLVNAIGPDTQKLLGDRLDETVSGALEGVLGDNAKWAGKFAHSIADWGFDELKNKVGGVKDAADKTRKAFADFGSGDTTAGVSKLVDGFGKLGVEVKDLPQPVQDVIGKVGEAKVAAEGFADVFANLPGKIGTVASKIGELAGPIAALGAAMWTLRDQEKAGLLDKTDASGHEDWWKFAGGVGGSWLEDKYNRLFHGHGTPGAAGPSGVDMGGVGGLGVGGDVLGSGSDAYNFFSSGAQLPAAPSGNSPAGSWFGGAGRGFPTRDVGSDKGLTPTSSEVKKIVSTMFPQINDIGGWRPPDGYNEHSSGQALDVMIPNASSPQGKALGDQISQYVLAHAKELGVDYTIWQHGQHNPDGSFQMYPDRGSPTQNHMDHVHIHTVRGGGTGGAIAPPSDALSSGGGSLGPSGGLGGPAGTPNNPIFVALAGGGGGPGGGSGGSGGGSFGGGGLQLPDFIGGAMQGLGLDGSVFHTFGGSSNPMQFGAVKLGTSLLNMFGGMLGGGGAGTHPLDHPAAGLPLAELGARHAALPGITPTSPGTRTQPSGQLMGGSGGGGGGMGGGMGGGINAAISGAVGLTGALMSDLNPGPGAPDSVNYHLLPNPTVSHPNPGGGAAGHGETVSHNYYGDVNHNPMTLNQHGVQGESVLAMQHANNGRASGMAAFGAGILPA